MKQEADIRISNGAVTALIVKYGKKRTLQGTCANGSPTSRSRTRAGPSRRSSRPVSCQDGEVEVTGAPESRQAEHTVYVCFPDSRVFVFKVINANLTQLDYAPDVSDPQIGHRSSTMLHITEDTPADMLSGAMDLTIHLPSGKATKMCVERSTPMMDLLVQITTNHQLQITNYTLQPMQTSPDNSYSDKVLSYYPNTPIGALDTQHIKIVPKTRTLPVQKNVPVGHQPFESTFRLKVHLPRNQLFVTRVSRHVHIGDIMRKVCEEKNLDPNKCEVRHPGNLDEELDPKLTLNDYMITEIYLILKGSNSLTQTFSANDIMTLRKEEERKHLQSKTGGGVFNLIFRRGKSNNGSGSTSTIGNSTSTPQNEDSRSVTPPVAPVQIVAPARTTTQSEKPRVPQRKRRPAPKPPQLVEKLPQNDPVEGKVSSIVSDNSATSDICVKTETNVMICHSRHSSDSSGYHETSILSEHCNTSLPRRTKGVEGERAGKSLNRHSQSIGNLAKMSEQSRSTSSLAFPGRKKKAAPPPPMPLQESSSSSLTTQKPSPVVASQTPVSYSQSNTDKNTPFQGTQTIINPPPVPRRRKGPIAVPRAKSMITVKENDTLVNETPTASNSRRKSTFDNISVCPYHEGEMISENPINDSITLSHISTTDILKSLEYLNLDDQGNLIKPPEIIAVLPKSVHEIKTGDSETIHALERRPFKLDLVDNNLDDDNTSIETDFPAIDYLSSLDSDITNPNSPTNEESVRNDFYVTSLTGSKVVQLEGGKMKRWGSLEKLDQPSTPLSSFPSLEEFMDVVSQHSTEDQYSASAQHNHVAENKKNVSSTNAGKTDTPQSEKKERDSTGDQYSASVQPNYVSENKKNLSLTNSGEIHTPQSEENIIHSIGDRYSASAQHNHVSVNKKNVTSTNSEKIDTPQSEENVIHSIGDQYSASAQHNHASGNKKNISSTNPEEINTPQSEENLIDSTGDQYSASAQHNRESENKKDDSSTNSKEIDRPQLEENVVYSTGDQYSASAQHNHVSESNENVPSTNSEETDKPQSEENVITIESEIAIPVEFLVLKNTMGNEVFPIKQEIKNMNRSPLESEIRETLVEYSKDSTSNEKYCPAQMDSSKINMNSLLVSSTLEGVIGGEQSYAESLPSVGVQPIHDELDSKHTIENLQKSVITSRKIEEAGDIKDTIKKTTSYTDLPMNEEYLSEIDKYIDYRKSPQDSGNSSDISEKSKLDEELSNEDLISSIQQDKIEYETEEWQLPSPPKAFKDSTSDTQSEHPETSDTASLISQELLEKLRYIENQQTELMDKLEETNHPSENASTISEDGPLLTNLSLENLEKRKSLVYNRELATSLKLTFDSHPSPPLTTNFQSDINLSKSLDQFENTLEDIRNANQQDLENRKKIQSSITESTLPNFKITTYDEPKENIKVFEDDTIHSNSDSTARSTNLNKHYLLHNTNIGRSMENISVRKNDYEEVCKRTSDIERRMFRPKSEQFRRSVNRSGSFSTDQNEWSPSKPVTRSKSQVGYKREEISRSSLQPDSLSKSSSLFDVSGLQSLEVMRKIQNKLNTPSASTETLSKTEVAKKTEIAPRKIQYMGPPTINMGTWSERPKIPVSVKEDEDYKLGQGHKSHSSVIINSSTDPTVGNSVEIKHMTFDNYNFPNKTESKNVTIKINGSEPISTERNGNVLIKIGEPNNKFREVNADILYRQPLNSLNKNSVRPHSVAFPSDFDISRVPVVRSVELKKSFKDSSNNTSTNISNTSKGSYLPNGYSAFSKYPSNENLSKSNYIIENVGKPVFRTKSFLQPIVKGFRNFDNTNGANEERNISQNRYSWQPSSSMTLPSNVSARQTYVTNQNVPFSKFNLRKTESKMLIEDERNDVLQNTMDQNRINISAGMDFKHQESNGKISKESSNDNKLINSYGKIKPDIMGPPPPPEMPKVVHKKISNRQFVPVSDPRDELLRSIRDFGGKNGLRSRKA